MYYRLYLYFYMFVLTFFYRTDLQILFTGLNWHFYAYAFLLVCHLMFAQLLEQLACFSDFSI